MIRCSSIMIVMMMLSGCAFKAQVQRFGVEYNDALAAMANEQTVLNILRASKGMPTHFTSVSRFTGMLSIKASSSVGSQIRGSGVNHSETIGSSLTTATTVGTSAAASGLTTTNSVVTTPGSSASTVDALAEGVDLYTPQIGGELNSGTSFEVQVFDQQKFYQGITSAVPFSTVEMLLNQGFEPDLVANLLIARVDFYRKIDGKKAGDPIARYRNDATDWQRFRRLVDCNGLDVGEERTSATKIVPIARLSHDSSSSKPQVALDQLALFDGDKFGLSDSAGISADGSTDKNVYVVKPGSTNRRPRLVGRSCTFEGAPKGLDEPSTEGVYLNNATAAVGVDKGNSTYYVEPEQVVMEVVFRSPEGVLRAVGDMVRLQGKIGAPSVAVCPEQKIDCKAEDKHREPIFVIVPKRDRSALLGARFNDVDYSIPADSFRSMQVVTIIQQLINLQKESSERALSIPVRAVP